MKKLIVGALLVGAVAGCHSAKMTTTSSAPSVSGNQTGGADATSALRGFLAAAKSQDIQSMGAYWGDSDGAARGRWPRDEEEKREIIMANCLRHDTYEVIGDAPAQGGGRSFAVMLTKPGKSSTANFDVVPAADHRWYVKQFDLAKLMADYCRK
jgi:hypothetical protein